MKKKELQKLIKNHLKDAFKEAVFELDKLYQENEENEHQETREQVTQHTKKVDQLNLKLTRLRTDMEEIKNLLHQVTGKITLSDLESSELRHHITILDTRLLIAELELSAFLSTQPHVNQDSLSTPENLAFIRKQVEANEKISDLYSSLYYQKEEAITKQQQEGKQESTPTSYDKEMLYREFDDTVASIKAELKWKNPEKYRDMFEDDE